MGMTPAQRLTQVELPLALPSIVAGVRVAAVVGVGTVTIAAAIGAGGLGEYIYRGLSMVDATVILAGAIPVAALAMLVDAGLLHGARALMARGRRGLSRMASISPALACRQHHAGGVAAPNGSSSGPELHGTGHSRRADGRRSSDTPDSPSEAQSWRVDLRPCDSTGHRSVCRDTRDGVTAIPSNLSNDRVVLRRFDGCMRTLAGRRWPLGFSNLRDLVRGADARARGPPLAARAACPGWRAAFGYEFLERPDGYGGLAATYGLRFLEPPRVMDLTLIYRSLAAGQVDVIAGDATAGLIDALNLTMLDDDRQYFPPYDALPVVHSATLLRHPEIELQSRA
jgi:osmoprotectant transport system permease protein